MMKLLIFFCKNTSLRGVKRVVSSDTLWLKLFWLFTVSTCLGGLTLHMYHLMEIYLQEPTIFVNKLEPLDNEPFPAISLCHRNVFTPEGYRQFDTGETMSPYAYSQMVRKRIWNITRDDWQYLAYDTYEAYFQNLGYDKLINITHDKTYIFHCVIVLRSGEHVFSKNGCGLIITRFLHSTYFSCMRLVVPRIYSTLTKSVAVSVRNTRPNFSDYRNHTAHGMPSEGYKLLRDDGVIVKIHEETRFPNSLTGTLIPSGSTAVMQFATVVVNRLRHHCTNSEIKCDNIVQSKCQQDLLSCQIENVCGCKPIQDTVILNYTSFKNFCMNIDLADMKGSLDKFECSKRNYSTQTNNYGIVCMPLCRETSYFVVSNLNHMSNADPRYCFGRLAFHLFKKSQDGKDNSSRSDIRDVRTMLANFSKLSCTDEIMNTSDVDEWTHFLVTHGRNEITVQTEVPIFSTSTFVSNAGGSASLWMGLTVTVLAELIEVMLLCIRQLSTKLKSPNTRVPSNERKTRRLLGHLYNRKRQSDV